MGVGYFRYYVNSSGNGFQHGLKYAISGDNYRRMLNEGSSSGPLDNPDDASDSDIYAHADNYFEYDSTSRKVTRVRAR